jgi:hypothetical protein
LPVFFFIGAVALVARIISPYPAHFPLLPVTAIFYSSPIYILFNARLANADYR